MKKKIFYIILPILFASFQDNLCSSFRENLKKFNSHFQLKKDSLFDLIRTNKKTSGLFLTGLILISGFYIDKGFNDSKIKNSIFNFLKKENQFSKNEQQILQENQENQDEIKKNKEFNDEIKKNRNYYLKSLDISLKKLENFKKTIQNDQNISLDNLNGFNLYIEFCKKLNLNIINNNNSEIEKRNLALDGLRKFFPDDNQQENLK